MISICPEVFAVFIVIIIIIYVGISVLRAFPIECITDSMNTEYIFCYDSVKYHKLFSEKLSLDHFPPSQDKMYLGSS